MNIDLLDDIFAKTTRIIRNFDETEDLVLGAIHVHPTMNKFEPEASERLVDMFYLTIAVDMDRVEDHREAFIEELSAFPQPELLSDGLSYRALAMIIGTEERAVRFLALGAALHLWNVITPGAFGFTGAEAHLLADEGLIMSTGYHPQGRRE